MADLSIEATPVTHGIPAVAYRFTSEGKSVVLSGDTAPCDNSVAISREADLLVIECSFPEQTGPKPGHLIPSQVGAIASEAKAKRVVLVHLFPTCKGKEESMIADVRRFYGGPVEVGNDMQSILVA
jgi:ribonuclease BN (tRNA processing enzyme)